MRIHTWFVVLVMLAITLAPRSQAEERRASPPHPRILATEADFARLRAAIREPGPRRDAYELLLAAATPELESTPVQRTLVGRRLLATSRLALRRVLNTALLYQLTGDKRWAARAEREMLALAAFKDWNPAHFLDVAEAASAVAIGYDWTYPELSEETRAKLRDALIQKALLPGDSDAARWRRNRNNWLQVCETGLTLAALAVQDHAPDLARRAVDRARRNVPGAFEAYEPAGSYNEGPSYWHYGTTYHVILIEALRTAAGSAGPLAENHAFLGSGAVINILTTPSHAWFNFGDCGEERPLLPVMFWFARESRRGELAGHDFQTLAELARAARASALPAKAVSSRFLAFSLLWMPPGPASAPEPPPPAWSTTGANALAVFRQGAGPRSLYVAMKGGRARNSHAHMDVGSFLLEADGQRWTTDLGRPDYSPIEAAGVDLWGKDRWEVYAIGPHSHSIPLIDDKLPDEHATAPLLSFSAETQHAVFDLTPLYAGRLSRLHRGLRVTSPASIEVRDELEGLAPGARYRFSWMTRATVQTDATGATLRLGGKTLRIDATSDAPFEVVDEDASKPPARHDAPNPGLRRLSIIATARQPSHFLRVRAGLIAPEQPRP